MDNESSRSKILLRDQSAKEKYFDSLVGGSGGGSGDVFFSPPSKMNFFDVHRDSSFCIASFNRTCVCFRS